jgi:hypothetical protein
VTDHFKPNPIDGLKKTESEEQQYVKKFTEKIRLTSANAKSMINDTGEELPIESDKAVKGYVKKVPDSVEDNDKHTELTIESEKAVKIDKSKVPALVANNDKHAELPIESEKSVKTDKNNVPAFEENLQNSNQKELDAFVPEKPKMVFVLTQARHGSTWLLDMLGYRENAVPIFEPLSLSGFLKMYALSDKIREETLADGFDPVIHKYWREAVLAKICICDWHGKKIRGYGGVSGLWYKDKRLNPNKKGRYDSKKAMEKCYENGSMMVPKTIRYYNISTLYKIQEFGCDSFKVVHLVRDPRAVMNSRMSVFHELFDGSKYLGDHIDSKEGQAGFNESYMKRAADWMCSHHLYNYRFGMDPPLWLKGRYKMVRYEDLAESPQTLTREILHFIGVKYTSQYREYVYNLTHVKDRGLKDTGNYGVEQQTSEIVDRWKKKLIEPHWRTIEKVCASMMKTFNYVPTFFKPE